MKATLYALIFGGVITEHLMLTLETQWVVAAREANMEISNLSTKEGEKLVLLEMLFLRSSMMVAHI